MTWEIEYAGTRKELADWGVTEVSRRLVNQAPDDVTFSTPGIPIDSPPLFTPGATIIILRDGIQWFTGRVVRVPIAGAGANESHSYRVEGPWWYFDHLVHEQVWYQATNPASASSSTVGGYKSRLILNQGFNGSCLTTGAQIAEAVAWAITNGAPCQATTSTTQTSSAGRIIHHASAPGWPDAEVPTSEATDITVAEVIRKQLRWHPDAVTWFDYATSPPTFHISRRTGMESIAIDITDCEDFTVVPRHDLQVPAVCLKFEQQQTVDGVSWMTTTKQISPAEAVDESGDLKSEYRFGALVATIDLMGSVTINEYSPLTTAPIAATSASAAARLAWWKERVPWLADSRIGELAIAVASRTSSLPRELVDGVVMPWQVESSEPDTITAEVSYRVRDAATDQITGPKVSSEKLSIRITATDAATGTYKRNSVSDGGEAIPQGLSAQIFSAVGTLHYEGSAVMVQEEVLGSIRPGMVMNLTGGMAAWLNMNALVQEIEEQIDSGTTSVRFGPPQHLGPQDLVELLRVNRLRIIRTRLDTRDTGKGGSAVRLETANQYPRAESAVGSSQIEAMGMRSTSTPGQRNELNPIHLEFRDPTADTSKLSQYGINGLTLRTRSGDMLIGPPIRSGDGGIAGGIQMAAGDHGFKLDLSHCIDGDGRPARPQFTQVRIPNVSSQGTILGFTEWLILGSMGPSRSLDGGS